MEVSTKLGYPLLGANSKAFIIWGCAARSPILRLPKDAGSKAVLQVVLEYPGLKTRLIVGSSFARHRMWDIVCDHETSGSGTEFGFMVRQSHAAGKIQCCCLCCCCSCGAHTRHAEPSAPQKPLISYKL